MNNNLNDILVKTNLDAGRHIYRLLFVDNFNQKPKKDFLVFAKNKKEAEEKGREILWNDLLKDISNITCGARPASADVLRVAPQYYNHLLNGCWTLCECERQDNISAHVSKRSAAEVEEAAEKAKRNNPKKRRWTAAEKRAAKEARANLKVA